MVFLPLLVWGFFFNTYSGYAQSGITTSGGSHNDESGSISYSVGQVFYASASSENGSLNEGIQQAYQIATIMGQDEFEYIQLNIKAFPNPTKDFLYLSINPLPSQNYGYVLADMHSKSIQTKDRLQSENQIDMSALPPAVYFLRLTHNNEIIKVFKIIKN